MGGPPPRYPSRGFDKDPLGVIDQGLRLCGPIFRMTVDGAETVLVGTSAGLGELFAAERGRLAVLNTALVHDLFGRAVFNLADDGHAEARRRLRTALSGRALSGYVVPLLEVSAPVSIRWAEQGVVDLCAAAREITLAMSTRVLLGIRPDEVDADEFATDFGRFVAATEVRPGRCRFAAARYWAGRRARRRLHALFARRPVSALAGVDPGSALPRLSSAFENAPTEAGLLTDHLLALLIAARETTASLITWCLIELARHSEHAERAVPEAHAAVTEPRLLVRRDALPTLRAVLAETQRLHSPNLLSMREAVCPIELGGYHVPTGMRVAYTPSAGHFDPEVFPQPHAFRPDRFLAGPVPAVRLWAFGGGAHACLGRPLAELMTVTALACALHQGFPRLPGGPPGQLRYRPAKIPFAPVPFVLERQESAL
ncbi:Cytochrome P450 [Amycolatopsis tolypomycina]|uniref:Cytochrome P450 n=2 Tax=Amycolatopsis tolypomycina TaxID=208445 RepID=A0A1H4JMW4_9PSEU|nr:Cytochrome P450 [Amycolatopsis tolypomycina]